jgi:hypothetical protein
MLSFTISYPDLIKISLLLKEGIGDKSSERRDRVKQGVTLGITLISNNPFAVKSQRIHNII